MGVYNRITVRSHLELEHGTEFFLPDLQGANLRGQSHDRGVEALVLILAGNNSVMLFYPLRLLTCKTSGTKEAVQNEKHCNDM